MSISGRDGDSKHNQIIDLLSAYIDNQLSSAERAEVDSHLEGCAVCRRELETLHWTVSLLRAVPQRRVPRSFTIPVPARAPERPHLLSLRWSYGFLRAATAFAALLLVLVVASDLVIRTSTFPAPAPAALLAPGAEKERAVERVFEAPRAPAAAAPPLATTTPTDAKRLQGQAAASPPATQAAALAAAPAAQPTARPAAPEAPVRGAAPPPEPAAPTRAPEPTTAEGPKLTAEGDSAAQPAPPGSTLTPPLPATPVSEPTLPAAPTSQPSPRQPSSPPDAARLAETFLFALTVILGLTTLTVRQRLRREQHD